MAFSEAEQVLANWIEQATSPPGQLVEGIDRAQWIARQFLKWWRTECVERPLSDAELAVDGIRSDLNRLGGWNNSQLGEAMHQLIHLGDALQELRSALGLARADLEDQSSGCPAESAASRRARPGAPPV